MRKSIIIILKLKFLVGLGKKKFLNAKHLHKYFIIKCVCTEFDLKGAVWRFVDEHG